MLPISADEKLAAADAKLAEANARLAEANARLAALHARGASLAPEPPRGGFSPVRLEGGVIPGVPELSHHGCGCSFYFTTMREILLEVVESGDGTCRTTGRQTIIFPLPTANLINQPGYTDSPRDETVGVFLVPCIYRATAQLQWKGPKFGHLQIYQPITIVPQLVFVGQPAVVWPRMQGTVGELIAGIEREDECGGAREDEREDKHEDEREDEHEDECGGTREDERGDERGGTRGDARGDARGDERGDARGDKCGGARDKRAPTATPISYLRIISKMRTESPSASAATPRTVTPSSATPRAVTPSAATPSAATPRAATPSAATPRTVTPRAATPSSATPTENGNGNGTGPKCLCGSCKTCMNRANRGCRGGQKKRASQQYYWQEGY